MRTLKYPAQALLLAAFAVGVGGGAQSGTDPNSLVSGTARVIGDPQGTFEITLDPERVLVRGLVDQTWQLEFRMLAVGRGQQQIECREAAAVNDSGSRIARRHGEVEEWLKVVSNGVEHGVTIGTRPLPSDLTEEPVHVEWQLTGDLLAFPADDARSIQFLTSQGVAALTYRDLTVIDAVGQVLPARFHFRGQSLQVVFDDSNAVYPVTIDPLMMSAAWLVEGGQERARFGSAVTSAGDVNGDGYSDVAVGAPEFDTPLTDAGRILVFQGSAAGLALTPATVINGSQAGSNFGHAVAFAGDINGDGYDDLLVGAPRQSDALSEEGAVLLYLGGPTGLATNAAWTRFGGEAGARLGTAVAGVSDVDQDGFDDVVVGAPLDDTPANDAGSVLLFRGTSGGLAAAPAWSYLGNQPGEMLGSAVAGAGDVNADRFADIVISAPRYDNGAVLDAGRVLVFHGSASTPSTTPDWFAIETIANSRFGASVSPAGDLNGDGFADLVVGGPGFSNGQSEEGVARVYTGGTAGLAVTPAWSLEGDQTGASLGSSVNFAGDLNGDGLADLAIGAPGYDGPDADEGRVLIAYGSTSALASGGDSSLGPDRPRAEFGAVVAAAGDVDGDGYGDLLIGAPGFDSGQFDEGAVRLHRGSGDGLATLRAWTGVEDQSGTSYGVALAAAGDVNGDGFQDLIVGAPRYDNGQIDEGRAYLYLGSLSGLSAAPAWSAEVNGPNARFGESVAGAGDVNGDGYDDLIVGAPRFSNGQSEEGGAFVYYGGPSGPGIAPNWSTESNQVNALYGASVAGAGDVNGDGYADVIVAATTYDHNGFNEAGRAWLYLGSASGLAATAVWADSPSQTNARAGVVAGVGDLDGDGFDDIAVGASYFSNGHLNEGRVAVHRGGPSGPAVVATWTLEPNDAGCFFGTSLDGAGDVDRDGFSDLIVGAPYCDDGASTDAGRAYLYRGGPAGPANDPSTVLFGGEAFDLFGISVSSAGDVNGDAYSDLLIGASRFGPTNTSGRADLFLSSASGPSIRSSWSAIGVPPSELGHVVAGVGDLNGDGFADVAVGTRFYGEAYVYLGNSGGGPPFLPRQMRSDGSAPIAVNGRSESNNSFQLRLTARSPLGRSDVRLQWQNRPHRLPLDGTSQLSSSSLSSDTGAPVNGASKVTVTETIVGLTPATFYRWRMRVIADSPLAPRSRWYTPSLNALGERDLRTAGATGLVDADGDGISSGADCNDGDPTSWAFATAARALTLGTDKRTLSWQEPTTTGSSLLRYDAIRSELASDFVTVPGALCVETAGSDQTAQDPATPALGQAYFYLIRPRNGCGDGPLGNRSDGQPRAARRCDCSYGCDDANACTTDDCAGGICIYTPIAPQISRQPQGATVCSGENARFQVVASGSGSLSYQWKKNGMNVGGNSPLLMLAGVGAADDGASISCVVTDGCDQSTSNSARLSVLTDINSCLTSTGHGLAGYEAPNAAWLPTRDPDFLRPVGATDRGEVILSTGEYRLAQTDLQIAGRGLDFVWTRTYRSRQTVNSDLGSWDYSYNQRIDVDPDDSSQRRLFDGSSRREVFTPDGACWRTTGRFASLCQEVDGRYTLTFADRLRWIFRSLSNPIAAGKIDEWIDRNGNRLGFTYDGAGRLSFVTDTLGRPITVHRDGAGRISEVIDFVGRVVRYEYIGPGDPEGPEGELRAAVLAPVVGTPTANDFSDRRWRFTYSTGLGASELNGNLLTVIDPTGALIVDNAFHSDPGDRRADQIDHQSTPDGTIHYVTVRLPGGPLPFIPVTVTVINDENGHVSEAYYDSAGRLAKLRRFTGVAPCTTCPTDLGSNRPTSALRPGDPPYFEWTWQWSSDALPTQETSPEGNSITTTYDTSNASVRMRGNRLTRVRNAGPRGAQFASLTESWSYGGIFGGDGFWTSYTNPRGLITTRVLDSTGNRTQETKPSVVTGVLGGGTQTVQDNWTYNAFGQTTRHTTAAGRHDDSTYFTTGPESGYLASEIVDSSGLQLTTVFQRDALGRVTQRIDPRGFRTRFTLNEDGRVLREVRELRAPDLESSEVLLSYDALGRLLSREELIVDADGSAQASELTTFERDALGRVTAQARALDASQLARTEFTHDPYGGIVLTRSPEAVSGAQPGNVTRTIYDERGLPYRKTRGFGSTTPSTTQFDYDGNGNLVTERRGLEHSGGPRITTHSYNGHDWQIGTTDPLSNQLAWLHDQTGAIVRETQFGQLRQGTGSVVRLRQVDEQRDELGRLTRRDQSWFDPVTGTPIGDGISRQTIYYAPDDRVIARDNDAGQRTTFGYDTARRMTLVTDPLGNEVRSTYDASGNLTSSQRLDRRTDNPSATETTTTTMSYDGRGLRLTESDNLGRAFTWRRNTRGDVERTIDRRGNVLRYVYDRAGRRISSTVVLTSDGTGSGSVVDLVNTTQAWDRNSRLIAETDDAGYVTTRTYDSLDREAVLTLADGITTQRVFNVFNEATQVIDPNATTTTSTYDALGRLTQQIIARGPGVVGTTSETFVYDGASRLVEGVNAAATIRRSYDSLSQLVREESVIGSSTSVASASYDGDGNQLTLSFPTGRVTSATYNADQRIATLSDSTLGALLTRHYVGDRLKRQTYGNGLEAFVDYDSLRDPASLRLFQGLATLNQRDYAHDAERQLLSRSDPLEPGSPSTAYEYDSLRRLTRSTITPPGAPAGSIGYTLDGRGNRTQVSGGPDSGVYTLSPTTPEPADAQVNQYTSTPFDSRTYTRGGALASADAIGPGQRTLAFDYLNRLVQFSDPVLGQSTYQYDVLGRRVVATYAPVGFDAVTTHFRYLGEKLLETQPTGGGGQLSTFSHTDRARDVVHVSQGSTQSFVHRELCGTPLAAANLAGAIVETYEFDDFGAPDIDYQGTARNSSQIGNRFLYSGLPFDDETTLYSSQGRAFEPRVGRWLARARGIIGEPSGTGGGIAFGATGGLVYEPEPDQDPATPVRPSCYDPADLVANYPAPFTSQCGSCRVTRLCMLPLGNDQYSVWWEAEGCDSGELFELWAVKSGECGCCTGGVSWVQSSSQANSSGTTVTPGTTGSGTGRFGFPVQGGFRGSDHESPVFARRGAPSSASDACVAEPGMTASQKPDYVPCEWTHGWGSVLGFVPVVTNCKVASSGADGF